jgi:DedD protein
MAFFKIRKSGDPSGISSESTQTLDGIRLRAIFRLIGAAVLVAAAVIGFPLVFDSQPRPIAIDVSIDIPDKVKVSPLALPRSLPSATSPVVPKLAPIEEKVAEAEAKPSSAAAVTVEDTGPVAKGVALDESKSGPKPVSKPTAKPAAQSSDGAKVLALLEGRRDSRLTRKLLKPKMAKEYGLGSVLSQTKLKQTG